MARYIITGNYTSAAMRGMVAKPSDRGAAVKALVAAGGGKMEQFYATTGDSDFLVITQADDIVAMLASLMAAGATGTVSNLKTVQAFTSAEFLAAQKAAGAIASKFKPAG
jgi:uncharacterized protein with GYD domain